MRYTRYIIVLRDFINDAPQALSYAVPIEHELLNRIVFEIFSIKAVDKEAHRQTRRLTIREPSEPTITDVLVCQLTIIPANGSGKIPQVHFASESPKL